MDSSQAGTRLLTKQLALPGPCEDRNLQCLGAIPGARFTECTY